MLGAADNLSDIAVPGTGPGMSGSSMGKDEDGLSPVRHFLALSVSKPG